MSTTLVGGLQGLNNLGIPLPYYGQDVYAVTKTVTLAQLNAGAVLLPAAAGITLTVLSVVIIPLVTFTTATDIRLSDTTGTPVDVVTIPIASVTNGAFISTGLAGNTLGTLGLPLTANQGLQLRKTGSSAAGGTSLLVMVHYKVNN